MRRHRHGSIHFDRSLDVSRPGFENDIVGDEPIERPEKGDTKLRKRVTEI
jgi:hypothetical protein